MVPGMWKDRRRKKRRGMRTGKEKVNLHTSERGKERQVMKKSECPAAKPEGRVGLLGKEFELLSSGLEKCWEPEVLMRGCVLFLYTWRLAQESE